MRRHRLAIDLGPPTLPIAEKVDRALSRLGRLNPSRERLLREWLATFEAETEWVTGEDLIDEPDTGGGIIPRGCELKQIAIQKEPRFPSDNRYIIDKELWDLAKANPDAQAGLILHELLLREARTPAVGHLNSVGSRYFNSLISSAGFERTTLKSYLASVKLSGFKVADAQGGIPIRVDEQASLTFHDDHTVARGEYPEMNRYFSYAWAGQTIQLQRPENCQSSWAYFHPSGVPTVLYLGYEAFRIKTPHHDLQVDAGGGYFPECGKQLRLAADGKPTELLGPQVRGVRLKEFEGACDRIVFDPEGRILHCGYTYAGREEPGNRAFLGGRWRELFTGADGELDFAPDGSITDSSKADVVLAGEGGFTGHCEGPFFFADGQLRGCKGSAMGTLELGSWKVELFSGEFELFAPGRLRSLYSYHGAKLGQFELDQGWVELYPSGKVKEGQYFRRARVAITPGNEVSLESTGVFSTRVRFHETGVVAAVDLGRTSASVRAGDLGIRVAGPLRLHPNGSLACGRLEQQYVLPTPRGSERFREGSRLELDENGAVVGNDGGNCGIVP